MLAKDREVDDGAGIRIGLDDEDVLNLLREVPFHPAHRFADIARGIDKIDGRREFHPHTQIVFFARRADGFDAIDTRDGAFDDFGHLGVDHLGRAAGEVCAYRNDRTIDIGKLAHFDAENGADTGDDDQQIEDRCQIWALHGQCRKVAHM